MIKRLLNETVAIGTAIRSIILCSIAFGASINEQQLASIMLVVETILMILTRAVVTPNHLAEARVDAGGRPSIPLHKQNLQECEGTVDGQSKLIGKLKE